MTADLPVALVTGASSGLGAAAAEALADAGFQVIGTARNTSRLTAPSGVAYLDLDVTSDESSRLRGQAGDRPVRALRRVVPAPTSTRASEN